MARPNDVGVGVAIVLMKGNEMLLLRRQGSHAAGTWAFPGGWVDRTDKDPFDVVRREALEEVGVVIHDAELAGVTSEDHPDFRTVTLYYLATGWSRTPKICEPHKCSELMWHPIDKKLPDPVFPGLDRGVEHVRDLIQSLETWK
jgi:8-oxo-dGTP diphosphatase